MSATIVTGSANITLFDQKITGDLYAGNFIIDVTPSVFLNTSNLLGVKIQIKNPYGFVIRAYGNSYDIVAPFTSAFTFAVPTQLNKYQYGTYTFEAEITETGGVIKHYNSKSLKICENPDVSNVCISLLADCKAGHLNFKTKQPPPYQGVLPTNKVESWLVKYPTGTIAQETFSASNISLPLFEGVYNISGTITAVYPLGDNTFAKLGFTSTIEQPIKCYIDFSCFWVKIKYYVDLMNNDCDIVLKQQYDKIIKDAIALIEIANYANVFGNDPTEYITQLEELLDCACANCSSTSEVINGDPAENITINGVGVTSVLEGLTRTYTINNYSYVSTADPAQNIITISGGVISGSVVTQTLSVNIANLYAAVKTQINNFTEYTQIGTYVKNGYVPSNPTLAFLGISIGTYNSETFAQFLERVMVKMASCCGSVTCLADITELATSASGMNTLVDWGNVANVYSVDIYVDDNFVDNVLAPLSNYLLVGYNDGTEHTVKISAKCSNGAIGETLSRTFNYAGCDAIISPSLSSNVVTGATCPYDLTTLHSAAPVGFTYEWHNANNTSPLSLVPNPASVSSGIYFIFSKQNTTGCYSPANQVILTCAVAGNCTEPLSMLVESAVGGALISFSSAAIPPPSYLVKRRLASDPDVGGSYSTIGAPTFNGDTNKWEILDAAPTNNTLYVYKAESQCSDATRPSSFYTFAKITCPVVTLTPAATTMGYSFTNVGGGVDKYIVSINTVVPQSLITSNTITPAFASPITGSLTGLTASTNYEVVVGVFIGTYLKKCPSILISTTA